MCGRFTLHTKLQELADAFGFDAGDLDINSRYNIAPSQDILAVRFQESARRTALLRWGLIPSWSKDPRMGTKMINARSETVASKPAFRSAFRKRRCLVPADGYYEWKREGSVKSPWYFRMRSRKPFAMAGLWEEWISPDQGTIASCCLLTCGPNELMLPVHDRMPVILDDESARTWLDPAADPESVMKILEPFPAELMTGHAIGKIVNNPRHDSADCIEAPAPHENHNLPLIFSSRDPEQPD